MNTIVGIQVDVRENASAVAPRIVDQLAHIGDAGEEAGEKIQKAFDTTGMQSQFDRFADKMDKVFGKERELKIKNLELRNQGMEQRLNQPTREQTRTGSGKERDPDAMAPGRTVGRVGSALAGMGDTGNPMPAAGNVLEGVSGMVSKAGPVGMAIAAVGALAAGTAMVVDALSKQYEQFVPTIMDTTAAFGDLKKSAKDNSETFRDSLQAATKSANAFGYSIEQGLEVRKGLGKGGIGSGAAGGLSDSIFAYARGFGVDPGSLVGTQVMGSRYKQGNVLGMAAGGVAASGMGAGRYDEYLQAMAGTFEASLSKGVVKGFGEISSTMNFFSKLGDTWKGQLGSQRINQLSGSFEGATSLQKETDVLMYRAAQDVVKKSGGGKTGSYLDTMTMMERGMTPELFRAYGDQLRKTTGGNQLDMVEMTKESFGTNYTTAIDLVKAMDDLSHMTDDEIKALLKTAEPPKADSAEMQLLKAEGDLRSSIVSLGTGVIDLKLQLITSGAQVVNALSDFAGVSAGARATSKWAGGAASDYAGMLSEMGDSTTGGLYNLGITRSIMSIATDSKYEKQRGGAGSIIDLLGKMPKGAQGLLFSKYAQQLQGAAQGIGNKDWQVDPEEMNAYAPLFQKLAASATSDWASMYKRVGSTPKMGSLGAFKAYGGFNAGLPDLAPENQNRGALDDLMRVVGGYKGKNSGALTNALTGMSQGQVEMLQQTGGWGKLDSEKQTNFWGALTDEGALALLKAIQDLTLAMNQPTTIVTEDARGPGK